MTRSLNPLSLPVGETPSSPRDFPYHGPRASGLRGESLWLAVHLPRLALESLTEAAVAATTIVVEPQGEYRIVAADDRALDLGIKPGLKLSAAYALCSSLRIHERRPALEQDALEDLAQWARRLTPLLSLASSRELLMEVGGSLKLFGGLRAIKSAVRAECERRQLTARLCAAPTALAALWLARHGSEDVLHEEMLAGNLGKLPLGVTEWPERTQNTLRSMSVRTIGDCLRLPRDGFIRRIGRDCLRDLDRSLGGFDSWSVYRPPLRFSSTFELAGEIADPAILAHAGGRLIENLAAVLRVHQVGVASFEVVFRHSHRPATVERINLAGPTRDRERFARLFLDRLDRLSLPAPVVALALRSGRAEPVVERSSVLFRNTVQPEFTKTIGGLVELLRERFGVAGIFGIDLVAEHRPEAAWKKSLDDFSVADRDARISPWATRRPLWLLPRPLSLADSPGGLPRYQGREPLRPRSGPERIETGWWSGEEIRRDYYTAATEKGEMLWIFRDRCGNRGWFLHGIFG